MPPCPGSDSTDGGDADGTDGGDGDGDDCDDDDDSQSKKQKSSKKSHKKKAALKKAIRLAEQRLREKQIQIRRRNCHFAFSAPAWVLVLLVHPINFSLSYLLTKKNRFYFTIIFFFFPSWLTRSAMLWGSVAWPLLARTRCLGGAVPPPGDTAAALRPTPAAGDPPKFRAGIEAPCSFRI